MYPNISQHSKSSHLRSAGFRSTEDIYSLQSPTKASTTQQLTIKQPSSINQNQLDTLQKFHLAIEHGPVVIIDLPIYKLARIVFWNSLPEGNHKMNRY